MPPSDDGHPPGDAPGQVRRVLVIGSGPVGQTTALLLARWGIPVVLLEARPQRHVVGSRAICQQRDVLDVWDWVGAGAVLREGLTWTTARTFYRDQELYAVELPDPGHSELPPFVNISQSRTEQILDDLVAASPLIDVRWGHEVEGLDQDEDSVRLRCRTTAGPREVVGAYAVACGGGRATDLRGMLGVDFPGHSFTDPFLICDIRADLGEWARERRFYFDPEWNPGRQVLIHPCPDSTYRIDWQVEPGFDLAGARADGTLDRRIRHIIGDRPYEVLWSSVYRFHSRRATRMACGRVLLAGDLAHLLAPFGARGLNSGVGDADNAAWKLAFVLRGWAPPSLLDSYAVEREGAAAENLAVTTATMEFLVPHTPGAAAVRRQVLQACLTDPAARERVDSGRLAEPFWYVDSPLTTPDPQRPWPGRPRLGESPEPVPGVILPDAPAASPDTGARARLRELVRGRVTVLADPDTAEDCHRALAGCLPAGTPGQVLDLAAVDHTGALRQALRREAGDLWVIRPDAYTAACVPSPTQLPAVARRAVGLT